MMLSKQDAPKPLRALVIGSSGAEAENYSSKTDFTEMVPDTVWPRSLVLNADIASGRNLVHRLTRGGGPVYPLYREGTYDAIIVTPEGARSLGVALGFGAVNAWKCDKLFPLLRSGGWALVDGVLTLRAAELAWKKPLPPIPPPPLSPFRDGDEVSWKGQRVIIDSHTATTYRIRYPHGITKKVALEVPRVEVEWPRNLDLDPGDLVSWHGGTYEVVQRVEKDRRVRYSVRGGAGKVVFQDVPWDELVLLASKDSPELTSVPAGPGIIHVRVDAPVEPGDLLVFCEDGIARPAALTESAPGVTLGATLAALRACRKTRDALKVQLDAAQKELAGVIAAHDENAKLLNETKEKLAAAEQKLDLNEISIRNLRFERDQEKARADENVRKLCELDRRVRNFTETVLDKDWKKYEF